MKKILLTTVALCAIAGTASAADLPARMPVKAPPIVAPPAFNWTGCYVGGYVGGAWSADDDVKTDLGQNGAGLIPYNGAGIHSWAFNVDSSVIGGGTVGCNWQGIGSPFVLGLEGEIGYMRLTGSAADPLSPALDTVASARVGDWYGMITGRVGYAADRVLIYAKGGAAFVERKWSVVDNCFVGACGIGTVNAVSTDNNNVTWTVGGGIEWAWDANWSVKAEYMFIGDDRRNNNNLACGTDFVGGPAGVPFAGGPFCWQNDSFGIHTAKIGINYRFGSPLAPVVARY